MEVYLCQLCKEPIWNFVCIECLAEDIRLWLPGPLSSSFRRFTDVLLFTFHYSHNDGDHHLRHTARGFVCNSRGRGSVCLYCYLNEAYQWLKEEDTVMAEKFLNLFNFGMRSAFEETLLARPEPIDPREQLRMEGFCEECESLAEVTLTNEGWVCEDCIDAEKRWNTV